MTKGLRRIKVMEVDSNPWSSGRKYNALTN